jgi:hypothetical protein
MTGTIALRVREKKPEVGIDDDRENIYVLS